MEKLEAFFKDYNSEQYDQLPKFLKRRVDALKKLQLEHTKILQDYHKELQELELKYEKLYQPLYEKRSKIVNGLHEPSDDECQLPANIVGDSYNGDQENDVHVEPILTDEEETQLKSKVKGIPAFWLGCLVSTYNFSDSIEEHDRKVLVYLKDIKLSYQEEGQHLTYKLSFFFDDNPYFTNKVLTKTYYLQMTPDEADPFSYEGFEVVKSVGCDIDWNQGKDVTTTVVTVRQQNKNDGRIREKRKEMEQDSFFYFFKPPQPEDPNEEVDPEMGAIMAVDFELGEVIRQSIIPKAALYYNGYMGANEDDDSAEETDEEDDSDEEVSSEESSESNDSLSAIKDKLSDMKPPPKT